MLNIDAIDGITLQSLEGKLGRLPRSFSGLGGTAVITTSAGAPTSALKLPKGSLCSDTTNAILYQTTDAVGTWVKVGAET